jgi:hypothetical protein
MLNIKDQLIEEYGEDLLFMDGYDDCIIGICHQFGRSDVIAYDNDKVITKMIKEGMTKEEAIEF